MKTYTTPIPTGEELRKELLGMQAWCEKYEVFEHDLEIARRISGGIGKDIGGRVFSNGVVKKVHIQGRKPITGSIQC